MLHTCACNTQGRAGQGRAGQGRAGQGRAGQGRAGQGRAGQGRAGRSPTHLCEVHWEAVGIPHLKCILAVYILLALSLGSSCSLLEAGYALVQCPVEAHLLLTAAGSMGMLKSRQGRVGQGRAGRGRAGQGRAGQGRAECCIIQHKYVCWGSDLCAGLLQGVQHVHGYNRARSGRPGQGRASLYFDTDLITLIT